LERALFDIGGVGIRQAKGFKPFVCGARGVIRDHVGRVQQWTPILPDGYADISGLLLKEDKSPMLEVYPVYRQIEPFLKVYSDALRSLGANVFSMRQPVLLEGAMENKVEGQLITWELVSGQLVIPSLASKANPYKVLDLGVKDFTSSLGAVMDAMDREILTVMGIRNSGTEKASGVTTVETTSLHQQLILYAESNLAIRQDWADRVSNHYGLNVSVKISKAYQLSDTIPEGATNDSTGETEGDYNSD